MADVSFMQQKFSVEEMVNHYLEDIKALRTPGLTPAEETKLQLYYQAASTFKRVSVKDLVQFALAYGRGSSGKSAQMRDAFSMVLGNRVTQASPIDLAYAKVLLTYTIAFKDNRENLKNGMLKFVLCSRFSPLYGLFEREILYSIENTQQKIELYQANGL